MIKLTRAQLLIGGTILVGIMAAITFANMYLDDQRSAALASMEEAAACEQLGRQIESQRARGTAAAATQPQGEFDLTRQVAAAAADAGIPPRDLDRIEHDAPRRAGAGGLVEKPTRLTLRQATLRQLATMLQSLVHANRGLRVDRLHLVAPADASDRRVWSAEVTLVYAEPPVGPAGLTVQHN